MKTIDEVVADMAKHLGLSLAPVADEVAFSQDKCVHLLQDQTRLKLNVGSVPCTTAAVCCEIRECLKAKITVAWVDANPDYPEIAIEQYRACLDDIAEPLIGICFSPHQSHYPQLAIKLA